MPWQRRMHFIMVEQHTRMVSYLFLLVILSYIGPTATWDENDWMTTSTLALKRMKRQENRFEKQVWIKAQERTQLPIHGCNTSIKRHWGLRAISFFFFRVLHCLYYCFVFDSIMSWNCLFSNRARSLRKFKEGRISIFWILCVQKEKDKNRNEIKVLYFIYKRTFRYGDVSLIYLFTNIFIHFCPGLNTVSLWNSAVPSQMYQTGFIPIICK